MVDPFATQNPQQAQQGTDNHANTHDQEAFGGTPNIFADMAASAFQPLDPQTGKPIPHTSETIDPFLRDTGSDTTDTEKVSLDDTTTEALEDPFLTPTPVDNNREASQPDIGKFQDVSIPETDILPSSHSEDTNNHYDPFLDDTIESDDIKEESIDQKADISGEEVKFTVDENIAPSQPEAGKFQDVSSEVGIPVIETPLEEPNVEEKPAVEEAPAPTVIQGLVDGMIDQFMPTQKSEDKVVDDKIQDARSSVDVSSEEMKFTVDETEIDEGGNLKAMPTGRQAEGENTADNIDQKIENEEENQDEDMTETEKQKVAIATMKKPETEAKVEVENEKNDEKNIKAQSVTEVVDDTTIATQSDLVHKFHALLDAIYLVHRYRDDSSEFSVVGADNDALSIQYDFDTEDDNHIVISKHETDRKTSTQQTHIMQFALDEDGELELYVNDVLLFTEAQLQDEMKSKMQVGDKFAKFIFLVTQFAQDQEALYAEREEQVEQEKAKKDFGNF